MTLETPHLATNIQSKTSTGGWVLTESMIAIGVGIGFLVALIGVLTNSSIGFSELGNYINMDRVSRNALDKITTNIRSAKALVSFDPAAIVFAYDAGGTTNLAYRYDSSAGVLTEEWTSGGTTTTTILLTGCNALTFSLYDRDLVPSSDSASGKVISVAWQCASTSLNRTNTQYMQQSQIVIRNQR